MVSTRRNRKIKKPCLKRKHRTRRNQRKLKGGTLSRCIRECHAAWPADPMAGFPTRDNPTPNGWYITMEHDRYYGELHHLHNTMDPTKSVFEKIPKHDGIGPLWLHEFKGIKGIDLPPLGYNSHGYTLSIEGDPNKLVWKKEGSRLIPYVYGEKEPGH